MLVEVKPGLEGKLDILWVLGKKVLGGHLGDSGGINSGHWGDSGGEKCRERYSVTRRKFYYFTGK